MLKGKFPGFTAKWSKAYSYRNSKIFIFDLQQDKIQEKIVVKISRNFDPRQVALEFENLTRFYKAAKIRESPLLSLCLLNRKREFWP